MQIVIRNTPIEVKIIRKNNKNIYFRIKDDLKLYISVPYLVTSREINKLIETNQVKILQMYQRQLNARPDPQRFDYLGAHYKVVINYNLSSVKLEPGVVSTPGIPELDVFCRDQADMIFNAEIRKCSQCFRELPNFKLRIRLLKTRWGVCNRKTNTITLNLALLKYDIEVIDYVIIHEMCHFFESNHGHQFWNLVHQACPNYKELRRKLRF